MQFIFCVDQILKIKVLDQNFGTPVKLKFKCNGAPADFHVNS